jgi:hypothetical protein
VQANTSQRSEPISDPTQNHLLVALICAPILVFVLAHVFVRDVISRQEITLLIKSKWYEIVFTDQGSFGFPTSGQRRSRHINLTFWNDLGEISLPKLTIGCSYRVKMVGGGLAGRQHLGENRMPPLNKIVKVLQRVEATEQECDVSAKSGKPVCRDDQVTRDNKGLSIKSHDCDFESYAKSDLSKRI